ncbi:hypothetical protein FRC98_14205 [Lujinxingia vulgaris]|uniref:Outer membrane protein beta-barrel domain-containing protein n=1 Tax=Lujinxingia vulgaris TaxID=2600176 RepID=A0A5C6X9F7_9DELT|nr:hypothetical protein [Lujinxingia vulgaris]TXD35824.1 hypothetical protein FRC98_14205 [Lujinxingia vulgaris]
MKKFTLIGVLMFALALLSTPAMAQEGGGRIPGGFGIGLGNGTAVSGISLKAFQGSTAIQGVIGSRWGYGYSRYDRYGGFGASVDLLFNQDALVQADPLVLAWSLGFGGAVATWGSNRLSAFAHGVAGLEFIFPSVPIDIVLEMRPGIEIYNGAYFFITGGAHIRFYL